MESVEQTVMMKDGCGGGRHRRLNGMELTTNWLEEEENQEEEGNNQKEEERPETGNVIVIDRFENIQTITINRIALIV